MQGQRVSARDVASSGAFIYAYLAVHCPLEQIRGRRDLTNDFIAGFTVGAIGVERRLIGMPFGGSDIVWNLARRGIPLSVLGGTMYGAIGAAFGIFNGRSF